MLTLTNVKLRPKLMFFFVLSGLLPLFVVGYYSMVLSTDALMNKSFDQLQSVQAIRKAQIEEGVNERLQDLAVFAQSQRISMLFEELDGYRARLEGQGKLFDKEGGVYKSITNKHRRFYQNMVSEYQFSNLLLISPETGMVLFAAKDGADVGTSLAYGPFKDTGLATLWRRVVSSKRSALVDYNPYAPNNDKETAFLGFPVVSNVGSVKYIVALELSPEFINHFIDTRQGMGESGESYVISHSANMDQYELRSNLQTMSVGTYVVGYELAEPLKYWQAAVKEGYSGGTGIYTDSAGKSVLAAYNRLEIGGVNWYLISKIDKAEVTAPIQKLLESTFILIALLIAAIAMCALFFSRTITRPVEAGVGFAKSIAQGDLDVQLDLQQKDELGELADALNAMALELRESDWLQRGKQGLDDSLRGEHSVNELSSLFIAFMTKHMGAALGAMYAFRDGYLELDASYAFTDRSGNFNRIKVGEGMVGQAAYEHQILTFSNVSHAAPVINYGAGEVQPPHYMVVPLVFEDDLLGTFLLGSMEPFTNLQRRFVEKNLENISVLLNVAKSRQVIKKLLEQAQEQQEELRTTNEELEAQAVALRESEAELQTQQEELRVTNEELEEQTRALRESEAELQAQQEELRVTNEELEEQTIKLEKQQADLRQKNVDLVTAEEEVRKKAEDLELASKYKSEFLANMSHELRTPLNSILILSQLMANNSEGNLTGRQIESASAINSSGTDLLNLINEILDLSKVEAGKVELYYSDVLVSSLVKDLKRIFNGISEEKGVGLEIAVAEDVPAELYTDSQRLQQVLRNLMTNAFKFTSKGCVSLAISRPSEEMKLPKGIAREDAVVLAVKDEGIGIPADKQKAIFEAFQQADGSTSRKYGGTGLGLSISKELVRLLGGSIKLESEVGVGSTFTIIIPAKGKSDVVVESIEEGISQDEAFTDAPSASSLQEETVSSDKQDVLTEQITTDPGCPVIAPVKKASRNELVPRDPKDDGQVQDDRLTLEEADKSLLIIEDDPKFARVLRDFARERGFKCIVAENGETGLHFADYYKPSAIILDIGLPGIDGWTVLERLKENSELRHIPVHFMSAEDSTLDAMRMGAVGFLTKPVSLEKIGDAFGRIENVITRPVRNLLVVEDDTIQRESIKMLIGNGDVKTTTVSSGNAAYEELLNKPYDCMILDLGLEDMSGFELLEKIRQSDQCSNVPVIVYTGRDLTQKEDAELRKYTESIIIKGAKSPERLLDESALFLHRVEANLPEEKQRMLKLVHDKETVLKGKNVLLVDDDMRNVFALTGVLQDKGMNVIVARNGQESLDKLESCKQIDVVLMDIMMPIMDGYEAMTAIRKNPLHKKLPIIALTAKAMKGDRSKCIEAGASDYLAKPVNTEKLISMLRVWLYA